MKERIIDPTAEDTKAALQLCCVDEPAEKALHKKAVYKCPTCKNTDHVPGAKICMICGQPIPGKGSKENVRSK